MKKFLVLIATVLLSIVLASLFGILHDQVTYTISNEYFTKFKFYQFGLFDSDNEGVLPNPRQAVAIVGFLATWWVGIIIGAVFGSVGLIFIDYKKMFTAILRALFLTFIVTIIFAFIGFLYGIFSPTIQGYFPDNLINPRRFAIVGSIHNFSYIGGGLGLAIGVLYLIQKNKNQRVKLLQTSSK